LASGFFCEFAKSRGDPVVQALAFVRAKLDQPAMKGGIHSQQKSPRIWLVGFLSSAGTKIEVIINRFPKCRLHFIDGSSLKSHDVAKAGDFAVKNVGFVIESNRASISLVIHHGFLSAEFTSSILLER
jgi:hypothetical protein